MPHKAFCDKALNSTGSYRTFPSVGPSSGVLGSGPAEPDARPYPYSLVFRYRVILLKCVAIRDDGLRGRVLLLRWQAF
jgi:hypothetical protein